MSMYFEDAGNKSRVWQCFVCGHTHKTYPEYKDHILNEHEEGREYVKCPDCGAPVRDMRMHYKAKHPKRLMPTGVQTRVAIWHDFKPGGDKKKTRKPKFRQGVFHSKKANCDFTYRSGMEADFYALLEQDVDVETFFAEPFKVPYFFQNRWHDYIPDLRINYIDGTTEIWEIKPATQLEYEQNQAKWAAMNDHASNMGWQFIVQTEVALGKLKRKLQKQLAESSKK